MPRTKSKEQYRFFTCEVPRELLPRIDEQAKRRHLSRNKYVRQTLEKEIEKKES